MTFIITNDMPIGKEVKQSYNTFAEAMDMFNIKGPIVHVIEDNKVKHKFKAQPIIEHILMYFARKAIKEVPYSVPDISIQFIMTKDKSIRQESYESAFKSFMSVRSGNDEKAIKATRIVSFVSAEQSWKWASRAIETYVHDKNHNIRNTKKKINMMADAYMVQMT